MFARTLRRALSRVLHRATTLVRSFTSSPVRQCCTNQLAEQRMRAIRATLEFGVRLSGHPERMVAQLDELHQPLVR